MTINSLKKHRLKPFYIKNGQKCDKNAKKHQKISPKNQKFGRPPKTPKIPVFLSEKYKKNHIYQSFFFLQKNQ